MLRSKQSEHRAAAEGSQGWLRGRGGQLCALACCVALAVAAGAGLIRGHAQSRPPAAGAAPGQTAPQQTAPQQTASASAPATAQLENAPPGNSEDARKQEITSECADLLKMALDLKAEVDKTTKDTLSVTVVRKASEIEQLARKVRTGSPKG